MRRAVVGGETGSAAAELVVLTPLLVVLVSVCFIGGRLVVARQQLDDAARTAAEAAAIASSPGAAQYAASVTVIGNLLADGLACQDLSISPQTAAFRPGGSVAVSVSCSVALSRLAFAGLPGTVRLTARRVAVIEPYRQLSS
jgi:Flp pilus assembly protein TadG